jgi:hypothetical protein
MVETSTDHKDLTHSCDLKCLYKGACCFKERENDKSIERREARSMVLDKFFENYIF